MATSAVLTFEVLDDLAVAVAEGHLREGSTLPREYAGSRAGPMLELWAMTAEDAWPRSVMGSIDAGSLRDFMGALRSAQRSWFCPQGRFGFMRLGDEFGEAEELRWTDFGLRADRAMQGVGLPRGLAGQLVGAAKELHSNVYEHSQRSRTGVVAFGIEGGMGEVIVADNGIGVLSSLRTNPAYAGLETHGEALRLALQPGVTRDAGDPTRGHGFDLMFTGLLNRSSKLRFRSGTAVVTIDGCAKGNPVPVIRERPAMEGFLISVECYGTRPERAQLS
jgi:hypothetical protein